MTNHCNPKCVYFPIHSYEQIKNNYTADENGIKHSKTECICMFDDHNITEWRECPNYKTHFNTLNNLYNEKMLVILGKSSAGKDFILNILKDKYGFNPVVSHTTRPKRINEVDGKDYHFVSNSVFSRMMRNNEFVETREYTTKLNGQEDIWYYGIAKNIFDFTKKNICVVDVTGFKEIANYYGRENILAIYIDVDDVIREQRAKLRGSFSQTEWDRRLKDDNKKFNRALDIDYSIKNNDSKEEFENNVINILRKENLII